MKTIAPPAQADAERHYRRGLAAMARNDFAAAEREFERAARKAPGDALYWVNLAQAIRKQGQPERALAAARRAVAVDPQLGIAHRMLAQCLDECGRHGEAADVPLTGAGSDLERAVRLTDRALSLQRLLRMSESVEPLLEAVRLAPAHVPAWLALADAFKALGMPQAAWECQKTAVELQPQNPALLCSKIHLALEAAHWAEVDADCVRLTTLLEQGRAPAPIPFMHLSVPGATAAQHLYSARAFAQGATARIVPFVATSEKRRAGRLRIGYLSNDFHEHATAYLLAGVLERHDRDRFEVFAYSYGPDDGSPMRARLKQAVEHFVDIREESARASAERIRRDGIDVLIDLKGYTLHARTEILAYRPAPVQAQFLGYPGSMGADFIDYAIVDRVVAPPEHAPHFSERLAYLPHSYQPNDDRRPLPPAPPRSECGLPEQAFVFCCFNNTYKITPQMFDLWCRLLARAPGSVLWLLDANLEAQKNLRREAAARGIDPQRLIFAPKRPYAEHLARLRNADLFLDTLPYNAHTTASDALWAGVPLVTCPGETFASRVAASLLHAAGLPELIAPSLEDYEALALRLAQQPEALAALKQKLDAQRTRCPLFDSLRFARALEALYERMVERFRSGQPPDHLALAPEDVCDSSTSVRTSPLDSVEHLSPATAEAPAGALPSAATQGGTDLAAMRAKLALQPYDEPLQSAYLAAVERQRAANRPAAIGLIVTCAKYFERARRLHARLASLDVLPLRLVVGRGAAVEPHPDLLEVDAPDDYESLPLKVREAFLHVFERYGCAAFKIDDDLQITDEARLAECVQALLVGGSDYAGFEVGSPMHDRTWHWNKCRDAALNRTPYGKRFHGRWANGPFYFLSAAALRTFALAVLRFPGEIEGELYEDKFVGDTLRAEGIRLTALPAGFAGIAADNLAPAPQAVSDGQPHASAASPWEAHRLPRLCPAAGDDRPLRVAVVTPYFKEERAQLERCIASVRAQTYQATHFLVADGHPQSWLDQAGVRHLRLDHAHADFGNTPRALGALLAVSEGFDAVAFLDADNWLEPDHVAACVGAAVDAGRPDYVIARRRFVRIDGSVLPVASSEDEHGHVDTSCLFLLRGAFHTIARWATMPRPLACIGDRIYVATLRAEALRSRRLDRTTVNYLCTWASLFRLAGEEPPPYAKPNVDAGAALAWWTAAKAADGITVDRLVGAPLRLS
jgi:predicted O-linked N-acetylglucosamine transferase (SPINDLY family)